jgi:small conductance mechanosensitive channel
MTLLQITTTVTNEATKVASTTFSYVDKLKDFAVSFAPKMVGAILLFIIGKWIISKIVAITRKILLAKDYDPSLETFLLSLVSVTLTILLFVSIAGILGVDTTAFSALIVGAGVAIGSALNGTLGNFAGGVMMLIFKPFKVGDMIEAQGITGVVTEQGVFNTTVLTADNKTVFVPNGSLSTGVITNYTTFGNLRVDLTMAVSPGQDLEIAKKVAIEAMLSHPKVLKTPAPEVSVLKVADGMVSLAIRPYCTQADYWDVYFGCTERVKNAWDKASIEGPTPHRVIINKNA